MTTTGNHVEVDLGRVMMTRGVAVWAEDNSRRRAWVQGLLERHRRGDWGDELPNEDRAMNNEALVEGGRLLSSYTLGGVKVWVITEADRSVTTVLFPTEY